MPSSFKINVWNETTKQWVPYSSSLRCYYLQQNSNGVNQFHPSSLREGYVALEGGPISEYKACRIQWFDSYYKVASRTSPSFVKPGQKHASDYALCAHNPDNSFREFKSESYSEHGGKVFKVRWDIAGKGDAWVSRSTTNEGYVRMRDTSSDNAGGMLLTFGGSWGSEIQQIPRIDLDDMGKVHSIYE
ncbi:hypothetical protein EC973_007334 [Apophysomyces ossiformis]|uniref:Uncharacterized protein n=1 Tax=Apophysomyces ossiformis TaxID=679940 RepID=A0A8H7ER02_9FUNG|nr:hypothetical protein EC973_007334 [Apophysomyces ossiformis]